jgi:hypothetical protein
MTLGEGIEAVAALANAGALIAALLALRNQRKELTLQRTELKLQREELAANREVMREQAAQAKETADAREVRHHERLHPHGAGVRWPVGPSVSRATRVTPRRSFDHEFRSERG